MSETTSLQVSESSEQLRLDVQQATIIEAVSPTATVERVTGGALLTVHDLNGETTAVLNDGSVGQGIPSAGTTGQMLAKRSNVDYDVEWVAAATLNETKQYLGITQ